MNKAPLVQKAREMAIAAHGDQKYGEHPYIYHLDAVAEIVRDNAEQITADMFTWMSIDAAVVVAYLHDTLEDTKLTVNKIETEFCERIATCVKLVTDPPGKNRRERKRAAYDNLAEIIGDTWKGAALIVKAADRLANVRECVKTGNDGLLRMYRNEHPDFRVAVYRYGITDCLVQEIDRLLK